MTTNLEALLGLKKRGAISKMESDKYLSSISIADTERLRLFSDLIEKRKLLTEINLNRIEELIVYCNNKVIQLGDKHTIALDPNRRQQAMTWQLQIMDFERAKMNEKKELFRDISFLQNEWVKTASELKERSSLDELL